MLTRLDQPMWPVAGLTKADVLEYYARAADLLLPYVAARPLRVVRFPDGVHARGQVDSELSGAPGWMPLRNGTPVVTDVASLLWVVDHAAVELHVALGPDPDQPPCVLFELEPGPGTGLDACCIVALRLRDLLEQHGLTSYVKSSAAFGLHVAVPVNGGADAGAARVFARAVAERLADRDPEQVTCDARRPARANRVLVDWRPNAPRRWMLPPYSLRAMLPAPGVSAPLPWDGLRERAAEPRVPLQVLEDAETTGDGWAPILSTVQSLPEV